jgi:hypothetical protein
MAIKIKWTEAKIKKMFAEGRGQGELASYLPWMMIREFNSKAKTIELPSPRYERLINLVSTGELKLFVLLERQIRYWDCREQFPLNRELAMKIAKKIGIDYPKYPGTTVPVVYSIDFLAVEKIDGRDVFHAFDMKEKNDDLEAEGVIRNLELHRAYCETLGFEHSIVTKNTLPMQYCDNLYRIRLANPINLDSQEASFFEDLRAKVAIGISSMPKSLSVEEAVTRMDMHFGLSAGSSLRAVEQLIFLREINLNLKDSDYLVAKIGSIIIG